MADPISRMASLGLLSPTDKRDAAINGLLVLGAQLANRGAPRLSPTPPPIDLAGAMNVYQTGIKNAMAQNMAVRKLEQEKQMRNALGNIDVSQLPSNIQSVFKAIAPYDPSAAVGLIGKTLTAKQGQTAAQRNFAQLMTMYSPEEWAALSNDQKRNLFNSMAVGPLKFQDTGPAIVGVSPSSGKEVVTLPKDLPPEQKPETKKAQAAATKQGQTEAKIDAAFTPGTPEFIARNKNIIAMNTAFLAQRQNDENRITAIDESIEILEQSGSLAAGAGAFSAGVPYAPATELAERFKTIRANIGFEELQKMREASPTGGALGQVAVQEIEYLQATPASLKQTLKPETLLSNLRRMKKQLLEFQAKRKTAYDKSIEIFSQGRRGKQPQQPQTNQTPLQAAIAGARSAISRGANAKAVLERIRQTFPDVTMQDIR